MGRTHPLEIRPIELTDFSRLAEMIRDLGLQGDMPSLQAGTDWSAALISGLSQALEERLVQQARAAGVLPFRASEGRAKFRVLLAGDGAACRVFIDAVREDDSKTAGRLREALETLSPPKRLRLPRGSLSLEDRPLVQAILNVTPDSFFDGGRCATLEAALARAEAAIEQGADILDVGGVSTRPGASPVDVDEECRRVLPVIEAMAARSDVPISVDTTRAQVARRAADRGAQIVNDVSGLEADPQMLACVGASGAGLIVMHMRGTPETMQLRTNYESLMGEIFGRLSRAVARAEASGMTRDQIIVDPGIGFGKTAEGNLEILRSLGVLRRLGCPILVGASRKSFLGKLFGWDLEDRLQGSVAAAVAAVLAGANIVRVHDVSESRKGVDTAWAIARAGWGERLPA